MKSLRKLTCVLLIICMTLVNTGVMFADTGMTETMEVSGNEISVSESAEEYDEGTVSLSSSDEQEEISTSETASDMPEGYTDNEAVKVPDETDGGENAAAESDIPETDPADNGSSESTVSDDEEIDPEAVMPESQDDTGTEGASSGEEPSGEEAQLSSEEMQEENGSETDADKEKQESPEMIRETEDTDAAAADDEEPVKEDAEEISDGAQEEEVSVKKIRTSEASGPEKASSAEKNSAETEEKAGAAEVTYTIRFNANGGSGTMPALRGISSDTAEKIPVNAFTNNGEKGSYVKSWNTKADGSGSSYAPNSALSAVTADLAASGRTAVTLYAQWTGSVTVNVRIQETHPAETVFGTQTGNTLYSRYNGGNYLQRSTDGGAAWSRVIATVSTDDEFFTLPRVSAASGMCISRPGYTNVNGRAYNTAKDGSGIFLRANQTSAGQNNPVNTTTLNGGVPITEAGHTVTIYVYWTPNTYSLKVHNNASSVGRESEETFVEYTDLKFGTSYALSNSTYGPENNTNYNWLLPSPKFYFEGYLFYGWNTQADGTGEWYSGFYPSFSDLTSVNGGSADLYALWRKPDGISEDITSLANGAVITKGYSDFSDVDLMITKYFTGEGRQTDPQNIEYGVEGGDGRLFWNQIYSEEQNSEDSEEDPGEEESQPGVGLMYLSIDLDKGTKQIYDLGDASAYVILKNRAYDMEGGRYDVKITISGIKAADYSGKYDTGNLFLVRASGSCNLYSEKSLSSVYDVSIEILKPADSESGPGEKVTDKTTVLYFADMDIPASTASREFLGQSTDDRSTYAYYDHATGEVFSGAEHIEVSSDDSRRIYINDENLIHAYEKDGFTQLVGTYYTGMQSERAGLVDAEGNGADLPTEMTSAAVVYDTENIRFRFGAAHASTALFVDDIFVNITANVRDSLNFDRIVDNGTGGYIDHGGEGEISFARGSSPAYSINAGPGYRIKEMRVDGSSIVENGSVIVPDALIKENEGAFLTDGRYTFENIQTDHIIDVSFERAYLPVDLLLHKVCSDGRTPADLSVMKDAEFSISFYTGIYTEASGAESSGDPERSWVFRTDEAGEIRMTNAAQMVSGDELFTDDSGTVCIPEGTLVIRETAAPAGFELNERAFVLSVKFDGYGIGTVTEYDENGAAAETKTFGPGETADPDLKIPEELSASNSITVRKIIYREDHLEEHGKPNFAFEISGTDLTGREHTYYRIISFDDIAEGEGMEEKTVTVAGIPSGRYVVKELEAYRFVTVGIASDIFDVVTESEKVLSKDITEIRGYACGDLSGETAVTVSFTDRKSRWDGYSDTSSAVNHIG